MAVSAEKEFAMDNEVISASEDEVTLLYYLMTFRSVRITQMSIELINISMSKISMSFFHRKAVTMRGNTTSFYKPSVLWVEREGILKIHDEIYITILTVYSRKHCSCLCTASRSSKEKPDRAF